MIEIGGMAVASEQESWAIDVWVCCQNLQGGNLEVWEANKSKPIHAETITSTAISFTNTID